MCQDVRGQGISGRIVDGRDLWADLAHHLGKGRSHRPAEGACDDMLNTYRVYSTMQDVDAAIEYVNGRPTPLALYVFSEKRKDFEYGKSSEVAFEPCRDR